jgi:hypothetical protein
VCAKLCAKAGTPVGEAAAVVAERSLPARQLMDGRRLHEKYISLFLGGKVFMCGAVMKILRVRLKFCKNLFQREQDFTIFQSI